MRTLVALSFVAAGIAAASCSTMYDPNQTNSAGDSGDAGCAPPAGEECCDGDELGTYTCDSKGNVLCSQGTTLSPVADCTYPISTSCVPPSGLVCCEDSGQGSYVCDSSGNGECSDGTQPIPALDCDIPPTPYDAGTEADSAASDSASDAGQAPDASSDAAND